VYVVVLYAVVTAMDLDVDAVAVSLAEIAVVEQPISENILAPLCVKLVSLTVFSSRVNTTLGDALLLLVATVVDRFLPSIVLVTPEAIAGALVSMTILLAASIALGNPLAVTYAFPDRSVIDIPVPNTKELLST
jgi:hypothetical protein